VRLVLWDEDERRLVSFRDLRHSSPNAAMVGQAHPAIAGLDVPKPGA
jgi:hypothetical protein